jgi:hypothetical protein
VVDDQTRRHMTLLETLASIEGFVPRFDDTTKSSVAR